MPKNSQELIALLIKESASNQEINDPNSYVEVINRERPQGFAEHFALLLAETPTAHSTLKPEFFLHFFLGSCLTLPNTALMSQLNIEDILFKLDKSKLGKNKIDKDQFKAVKLVFKIHEQNNYKLKLLTITTDAKEANSGFTREELAEVKRYQAVSDDNIVGTEIEEEILHIAQDHGFKVKILTKSNHQEFITLLPAGDKDESQFIQVRKNIVASVKNSKDEEIALQDFEPLVSELNDQQLLNVQTKVHYTFALLKKIYQDYAKVLGISESSYHGYIYGFFRLNYKYKYALDCYVERIAGKGYADLVLVSHYKNNDKNKAGYDLVNQQGKDTGSQDPQQIPIIVEIKARQGADLAIEQINNGGYIYNLPNIRTNAQEAIIVGVDFNTKDTAASSSNNRVITELKVETTGIKESKLSLLAELIQDKSIADITVLINTIQEHIKHLYYASIRSKDSTYLSRVLLGQSISVQGGNLQKYLFEYSNTITGGVVTTLVLKKQNQGIRLCPNKCVNFPKVI